MFFADAKMEKWCEITIFIDGSCFDSQQNLFPGGAGFPPSSESTFSLRTAEQLEQIILMKAARMRNCFSPPKKENSNLCCYLWSWGMYAVGWWGWIRQLGASVLRFLGGCGGKLIGGRKLDWLRSWRGEEVCRHQPMRISSGKRFCWVNLWLSRSFCLVIPSFHSSFRCFYTHSTDLRSPDWFTRNLVTFSTILSRNCTNLWSTSSKNLQKQVSTSPSHRTVPAHIKTISRFRLASQMTANDLEMPHHPHRHHDWCFLSANRVHFINFSASPGTEEIFNFPSTWHTSSSAKLNYLRSL